MERQIKNLLISMAVGAAATWLIAYLKKNL
jgi:hypothetical protein